MGSSCSADIGGNKHVNVNTMATPRSLDNDKNTREEIRIVAQKEKLCPNYPEFALSRKLAAAAMLHIRQNLDPSGYGIEPVVTGWRLCQSREAKGTPVFENEHTKERIRWVPLESASTVAGKSPDIECMKCHFCFHNFDMDGIDLGLDGQGNICVEDIDPAGMTRSGWGVDGHIAIHCFLTMLNGIIVPPFTSMDEFSKWKAEQWSQQIRFHALFAQHPGATVSRPDLAYLTFNYTSESIAGSASGGFSDDVF